MFFENVMVGKWRNKNGIRYILTDFKNTMEAIKNRRGSKLEKTLPVVQYNKYMGGIDNRDQMMAYYPTTCKTLRYPYYSVIPAKCLCTF